MHEVSLVAALVDAVTHEARGRPIALVRVRHASSITTASLQQAFTLVVEGGPLAGCELASEPFDIELTCVCGFHGALGHDDLIGGSVAVCPSCGSISTLHRTAELELLEVVPA